jgi:predicted O-methyltransferase YrrM
MANRNFAYIYLKINLIQDNFKENMSIEERLDLKFPIYWNIWPVEEQFARYLIYKIITHRPVNVVEFGGGLSSLIILKTLKKLGLDSTLTSFDSNKNFLDNTENLLKAEEVYDENKVKLVFAPIKNLKIGNNFYKWYDVSKIKFDFDKIDLLFVDGPIGSSCKNARYPMLNVMKKYLKKGSVVVLHDSKRPDEVEIVEMWKKENSEIVNIYKIESERGGVEIKF